MARYIFSAWMPEGARGKSIAEIILARSNEWNQERRAKGKEGYIYVGWQPEKMDKIKLSADDQVYIKGHHSAGLAFISDISSSEQLQRHRGNEVTFKATRLDPKKLTRRFHHCFHRSDAFKGKIKFFNCSSGVNGGESFARIAAARMRAYWPNAVYLGYADDLQQSYGDYDPPPVEDELENLRNLLAKGRRKMGKTTGKRASSLQVLL